MNVENIFAGLPDEVVRKRKKMKMPDFMPPMLATLTNDYFSSPDWIYEHKFDGERCLSFKHNGKVRLISRTESEMSGEYPELARSLIAQRADDFVIDGEIVALEKGISDFGRLQSRMHIKNKALVAQREKEIPIFYRIFDILYVAGYDIRDFPLLARKQVLKKLFEYNDILTFTEFRTKEGLKFFKQACELHWEGLIAKKANSLYVGVRSHDWLKFKCTMGQEFVIAGYTDPKGSRTDFGALLLGYYEHGKLRYAGKSGTGYAQETLYMLGQKLRAREVKTNPFADYDQSTLGVHWVKPELVADFKFANWTKAGKLRVPRYKGLRDDKPAKDVVKEVPK